MDFEKLLDLKLEPIAANQQIMNELLNKIHEQTNKTNGRVSKLEDWTARHDEYTKEKRIRLRTLETKFAKFEKILLLKDAKDINIGSERCELQEIHKAKFASIEAGISKFKEDFEKDYWIWRLIARYPRLSVTIAIGLYLFAISDILPKIIKNIF